MPVNQIGDIDQLALLAAKDERVFEELLKSYKPFIFSCVKRTSGAAFIDEHDDLASAGIIAFSDAVRSFDSGKAGFLLYAGTVIRNRVIDHLRQTDRLQTVSYESEEDGDLEDNILFFDSALKKHRELTEAETRRLEIESLAGELRTWNISFEQVYSDAPKHEGRRAATWGIIRAILTHDELCRSILQKRLVPVAEIEKLTQVPRKKIEKSRRFIIACILIAKGDYPMLREYLQLVEAR